MLVSVASSMTFAVMIGRNKGRDQLGLSSTRLSIDRETLLP
jgi:hypothetical protein